MASFRIDISYDYFSILNQLPDKMQRINTRMDKIKSYEDRIVRENRDGVSANDEDLDLDELMDEIEDEEFMSSYREKRMQEVSDHLRLVEKNVRNEGYGSLKIIEDESTLMKTVAKVPNAVVHFGLDKFAKCQYMDQKLNQVAEKYLTTMFLRTNVDQCPFLVSKLGIKVLPFVICYKNGQEVLRILGFSKLGNNPNSFPLDALVKLLRSKKVISAKYKDDETSSDSD